MQGVILRVAALREVELNHAHLAPSLMERAGLAAATAAQRLLGKAPARVLIMLGPGNNGGDGLVAARHLAQSGHTVVCVGVAKVDQLPPAASQALAAWLACGGKVTPLWPSTAQLQKFDLLLDAIFGSGLTRAPQPPYTTWIEQANACGLPLLALDVPSGLVSDTGVAYQPCIRATHTITFMAYKPGLLSADGPDYCGSVELATLGTTPAPGDGQCNHPSCFAPWPRPRKRNTHKGSYGAAGICGGAPGMSGAALLAARAALLSGAGQVYVGLLEPAMNVDYGQPELMLRPAPQLPKLCTALAIGPGLGQSKPAAALLQSALETALPLLIDADALNLLAAHPVLAKHLRRRTAAAILTPHPGEAARLLHITSQQVQQQRVDSAVHIAHRYQAYCVLKGCGTVLADPTGNWWINCNGNPGLATAGSGDVLSGIAVSLLAQGWPALAAAQAAVYVHAAAADDLVSNGCGPCGMSASEIALAARQVLNRLAIDKHN